MIRGGKQTKSQFVKLFGELAAVPFTGQKTKNEKGQAQKKRDSTDSFSGKNIAHFVVIDLTS